MKIAITGKIGSGKSSLAKELYTKLSTLDFHFVDVDSLTDACYKDEFFLNQVQLLFGTKDRKSISSLCFENKNLLASLEKVSIPVWEKLLNKGLDCENVLIDFPLLFETQFVLKECDLIIGVDAPYSIREQRACARLGWTEERFAKVDATQAGSRTKMSGCDVVFENTLDEEHLKEKAHHIAQSLGALTRLEERALNLVGRQAWKHIVRAYCEPHRHYHNGVHLEALFNALPTDYQNDKAISLAILYHDIVYQVGEMYSKNEALSCQALIQDARVFFQHLLSMPTPGSEEESEVLLAAAMIDCTKGHSITDPWILSHPRRLERTKVFLDADLSILSTEKESDFFEFDQMVRQEFINVDDEIYHKARAKAMGSFIDKTIRPSIYMSKGMSHKESLANERIEFLVKKHSNFLQEPKE